jgi:hypothetical protein
MLLFSTITVAQEKNSAALITALKKADIDAFTEYFDAFIDLKLPQKEEIKNIGKKQAGITVKNFFQDNSLSGFELTSQREIAGTMYIAGKVLSEKGGYNITIMIKKKGDDMQIMTLRIN